MPYTPPTVNYATTQGGTYTSLTGIQSVQINQGRSYFQDNFGVTTCTVELIPANSYATPLAIGQYLDVRPTNSAAARAFFAGQITDVRRDYEIPYNSGTGAAPADRITITAVGASGIMAAYTFPTSAGTLAADNVTNQMTGVGSNAGVFWVGTISSTIQGSAISLAGQGALDVMNKIARTAQEFLLDYDNHRNGSPGIYGSQLLATSLPGSTQNVTFSDTGAIRYNRLSFLSSSELRFNQVNVYPDGLATQSSSGTAPFNSLDYYTNNATTGDAASLAGLLFNLFNSQTTPAPFVLSTDTAVDDTWLPIAYFGDQNGNKGYLGSAATVTFRGATVTTQIQRIAVLFTPERATLTLNLSPSLGQAFLLDSSQFGILDTNRLGYP